MWPLLLALAFGLATWWFWSIASAVVATQYAVDLFSGLLIIAFGFMAIGTTTVFAVTWIKRRFVRRCGKAGYVAVAALAYGQAVFVGVIWAATLLGWL